MLRNPLPYRPPSRLHNKSPPPLALDYCGLKIWHKSLQLILLESVSMPYA